MNGVAWSPWGGLLSRLLNLVTTRVVYDDADSAEVEPAESDALEGAKELIRQSSPRVIVEMHSPPELPMVENCRRILGWCQQVGYRAYYLKEYSQIFAPDPIAHRGRCHLLLIPDKAEFPVWLRQIPESSTLNMGMLVHGKSKG